VKTDFYDIQKVYEQKFVKENLQYAPVEDTKNSFKLGQSTMGPGNGPVQPGDLDASQFDDIVMMPSSQEITKEMKRKMLIKFLDEEIVEGDWDDKTKEAFSQLLFVLL